MPDSTRLHDNDRIDRFARGELSPAEARELAQASLDSQALFDEVMATALAKAAAANVHAYAEPVRRVWWRSPMALVAAASLAILIIVSVGIARLSVRKPPSFTIGPIRAKATPALKPTLSFSAGSSQPILLASDLQQSPSAQGQLFRGEEPSTRAPRQTGSVISVGDGLATMDLGSLDGISKGTEVEVYRDEALKLPAGRLRVNTVFRERARGETGTGDVRVKYGVRTSDATYLHGLMQRADDLRARGQLTEARQAATAANAWAKGATVPVAEKAKTLELLAKLDFLADDAESAQAHYQTALEMLSSGKDTRRDDIAEVQNNLAVVAMLRGDYDSAHKVLDQAAVPSDPQLQADRLNNLGVLLEQGGNLQQAEDFYTEALGALPKNLRHEREIVEVNLARVKGPH